jgi:hypothetical protein
LSLALRGTPCKPSCARRRCGGRMKPHGQLGVMIAVFRSVGWTAGMLGGDSEGELRPIIWPLSARVSWILWLEIVARAAAHSSIGAAQPSCLPALHIHKEGGLLCGGPQTPRRLASRRRRICPVRSQCAHQQLGRCLFSVLISSVFPAWRGRLYTPPPLSLASALFEKPRPTKRTILVVRVERQAKDDESRRQRLQRLG